jgi:DNA ligase-1
MLLAALVAVSRRVGGLPSRNAKVAQIAGLLRRLAPDEVEIGASWLSGTLRQGRSGIGYALIRDARPPAFAATPSLTLAEVDAALGGIADTRGPGSTMARVRLLTGLLSRATADEYDFLTRLVLGELRQGALDGLMIDAVAAAAGVPVKAVRRAAMVGGGIVAVAHSALGEGGSALGRHAVAIFAPVAPMLAQAADDVESAMPPLGMAALEWKLEGAQALGRGAALLADRQRRHGRRPGSRCGRA